MAPNIRLKGPKSAGSKVTFSTECHIYNGQQIQKFNLLIRLPSKVLGSLAYPFSNQKETAGTKKQSKDNTDENIKHEDENSDSDLSSLDWELNKALSSSNTIPSSEITYKAPSTSQETQVITKNNTKEADGADDRSAGYRTIPKNLISIIKKELGDLGDTDDDLGMIEKMVFTLKDPLSASKIGLPVKSNLCQHFECFDFENFCIFNKIPTGVKNLIKKDLAKRNLDLKKSEKLSKLNRPGSVKHEGHLNANASFIHFPSFTPSIKNYKQLFAQPKVPTYKCPVCNVSFALNQLYISDVFNFFVKTTPKHIDRIELMDMVKYKIIDDSKANWTNTKSHVSHEPEELVILSDDDDDDSPTANHSICHNEHTQVDPQIPESTDDVFNDGLDNELLRLSNLHEHAADGYKGRGSWEDPVTLD